MVRPFATGYSPLRIWMSVPQMVVVVIRISASLGPTSGMGLSANSIRPGSTNIAALIILAMSNTPEYRVGNQLSMLRGTHYNLPHLAPTDLTRIKSRGGFLFTSQWDDPHISKSWSTHWPN